VILPILLAAAPLVETPPEKPFPEPTPALIEACLEDAVERDLVTKTKDSWKYICADQTAEALWNHLAALKLESWEQVVPEGTWLSRQFPLGGCFKRVKNPDGTPATSGLSCTVWIPRK
jgi:hypothetical protein